MLRQLWSPQHTPHSLSIQPWELEVDSTTKFVICITQSFSAAQLLSALVCKSANSLMSSCLLSQALTDKPFSL